jgi:hypothetical protein
MIAQAEETAKSANFYAKSVLIYKIYAHSFGYKVIYHRTDLKLGVIYLPFSWFGKVDSPADAVSGSDTSYPYFTAFYRDGKFDHIRLFLMENHDHYSWALLDLSADDARRLFNTDINSFKIEY